MKGRNLGWGLEIWGLIKCKSKVGLGHFDKSAGPLAHCTTAISNCEYSEIHAVLYSSRSYKEPNTGHCTNDTSCTAGQLVICSGEKLCSGQRCTAGQIAPIYPDLTRADPSQILPGGAWVCYMCLHVAIFNTCVAIFNTNVIIFNSVELTQGLST